MDLHLNIVGYLLIILSFLHAFFPRYFQWRKEMAGLSLINRQMMYVHTFFLALVLFLMGLLCLTSPFEISHSILGKRIAIGMSIFWAIRLIIQFAGYSSKLWKGKTFETVVHVLFSFIWAYFTAVFFLIYWRS